MVDSATTEFIEVLKTQKWLAPPKALTTAMLGSVVDSGTSIVP
jgi:hypothetical protein